MGRWYFTQDSFAKVAVAFTEAICYAWAMSVRRVSAVLLLSLALFIGGATALFGLALDSTGGFSEALGGAGLALNLSGDSYFANPALLGASDRRESTFITTFRFNDALGGIGGETFRLQEPTVDVAISFLAKNLALTIQSLTVFTDMAVDGEVTRYTGEKQTLFDLAWAFTLSPLSLGVRAQALAVSRREQVEVRTDRLLFDYVVETAISRYSNVDELSQISIGMGLLLDYEWIRMGVVMDRFAYSVGDQPLLVESDQMLKSLSWGIALASPTYTAENDLHLFKVEGAVDMINLGSDEEREVRMGVSLKLQLLPGWSISLLTGYREPKDQATDLWRFSLADGTHSVGIGAELSSASLLFHFSYPTDWYFRTPHLSEAKLTSMLTIHL